MFVRALQLILVWCIGLTAWGTVLSSKHFLDSLVSDADHVLVGRIKTVEIVDPPGATGWGAGARAGHVAPVSVHLRVEFSPTGVLKSTTNDVPRELVLPLSTTTYSLGSVQKMSGTSQVFFLRGPEYLPVFAGHFYEPVSKRPAIEKALGIQSTNIDVEVLRRQDASQKEKPIVEYGERRAYDDREALLEYQKRKAAEGNAEAQFAMGMRFLSGIDVERNETLAREFLELASRNGNLRAREKLRDLRKKGAIGSSPENR